MTLPVGTCLEKYEILEVLGQGGGGICYRAIDKQLNREVVLKEHFPPGLCHRAPGSAIVEPAEEAPFERSLHAFCREARVLAALNHSSVVRIYEVFGACGTAFLAMDYIKGKSLQAWMADKPAGKRIKQVLLQLLDALAYLHAAGIIHRDIKPDNILIQENDAPVLIDFGAALQGSPTHTLTLIGTPGYAAPEQFDVNFIPDARSDIYALGKSIIRVTEEAGIHLPSSIARTLIKASQETAQKRFRNAGDWKKDLEARPLRRFGLYLLILLTLGGMYLVWQSREQQVKPPASTQAGMELVQDPDSPYNGLPVGAPLHPIQLVHYDNDTCNFIRFSNAALPPREEAFVQSILDAQQDFDKKYEAENKRLRDDPQYAHKINWFLYKAQTKLNALVIQKIHNYLNQYYPEGDPYASWTMILISNVRELRVDLIRPLLKPEFKPEE